MQITDQQVIELYRKVEKVIAEHGEDTVPPTQFHRGIGEHSWPGQHPGGCRRHLDLFAQHQVIPEYCFGCYKVTIEPADVMQLFKLMFLLKDMQLEHDNTRKCCVETRPEIGGWYKGFIYCRGLDEARELSAQLDREYHAGISEAVSSSVKHGCSEYPLAYPDYGELDSAFSYREEWRSLEHDYDSAKNFSNELTDEHSYNRPGFTLRDGQIMLAWLKYAATIGDISYRDIAGRKIAPVAGLQRPPFPSAA